MRIVYFTDTREIGGAERNLIDMAQAATAAGHEVLLGAPQAQLVAWLREQAPGARVETVADDDYFDARDAPGRAARLSLAFGALVRWLASISPDLLHVNNGGFPGSDLCRLAPFAGRLARVPRRLMTVHSNPWERERLSTPALQSLADRIVWANVEAVLCPSDSVARGLIRARGMPRSLVRHLHYGVPEPPQDPTAVAEIRGRLAPNGELLVGLVSARPVASKGYDVFVDALGLVRGAVRGAIVGPVPLGLEDRIARRELGDRLALEGRQPRVGSFFGACDALAVPSTAEECMPLVILEAMASGTAVFAARLSGLPEAVEDGRTGRIFSPGAADQLAALLDESAEDREPLARMGAAGRERWSRFFTPERMAAGLLALYG